MKAVSTMFDAAAVKRDFPILNHGGDPSLVFLDSAASSQKPQAVIDALVNYYTTANSNVHRGVYKLAVAADDAFDSTREQVARFINAPSADEVIFTRGTTEAINLVAASWGGTHLQPGDLVVSSVMEHHSSFVPWQRAALDAGARFEAIRITETGELDLEHYRDLLEQRPKVVAITQVSNVLGTINPIREMIAQAHTVGAVVCIDAAQSAPHIAIDVQELDVDFLAFSGHKMLAPMGIGVLYGKRALLEPLPPYQTGGSMIRKVSLESTSWADLPHRFEAGTPSVGDVVGLGAAITYLEQLGFEDIATHEHVLAAAAINQLGGIPGVTVYGPPADTLRAGVVSFAVDGVHPHDVAALLDEKRVAVRAGHHCAQPLMTALGVTATSRASFYIYNTMGDVDRLIDGVSYAQRVFA